MNFPLEILTAIAGELDSIELSNFRLSSRTFAVAGSPLVPKNGISVINVANDIEILQSLLKNTSLANNVRSLRLFHVEWPLTTTKQWHTPSVWFQKHPTIKLRPTRQRQLTLYEEFTQDEKSRRYFDQVEALSNLFKKLPNLQKIIVSSLHDCFWSPNSTSRYQRLQRTIWKSPYPSTEVLGTLEQLFLASGAIKYMKKLHLFGCLDPTILCFNQQAVKLCSITHLTVHGFTIEENDKSIQQFLQSFPNLEEISISFHGWGPVTVFTSLYWPFLREASLHGVWTAEKEFYSFFDNHSSTLRRFDINNSSLTQGSWEGLFTAIRNLGSKSAVSASGELYGRTFRETLNMDCVRASDLEQFMADSSIDWPFLQV